MSKAAEKGRLDAKDEHDAKLFTNRGKKQLRAKVISLVEDAAKKVEPLEFAAVTGLAFLVYQNIPDWLSSILNIDKDSITNTAGKVAASYVTAYIFIHHAGMIIGGAADVLTGLFDIFKWVIISKSFTGASVGTASTTFWTAPTALPFVTLVPELKPEWYHEGKIAVGVHG